jgi:hypothetical protein
MTVDDGVMAVLGAATHDFGSTAKVVNNRYKAGLRKRLKPRYGDEFEAQDGYRPRRCRAE